MSADAARRLAADLAMKVQTPMLPDDGTERMFMHEQANISSGEHALMDIARSVECIGSDATYIDDQLRYAVASTLRRLAEVVEP
jgi:hypothetical protein